MSAGALSLVDRVRLGRVRPELLTALEQLYADAYSQLGFTLEIPTDGGTRSNATQEALYDDSVAQGHGTLAYPVAVPGNSRHEYGAGVDVDIVGGGSGAGGVGTDADYRALAQLGQQLGLTAGYFFSRSDPYHFQLNETLAASQAAWAAMPASSGWKLAAAAGVLITVTAAIAASRR